MRCLLRCRESVLVLRLWRSYSSFSCLVLRKFFLKIGGNNPRGNIHRALSKIFTNKCAMNYSWKDICNNFKISDLYFIKIMRKITLQHSSLTEAKFNNIVAKWLRFAKQKKQRKERAILEQNKNNKFKQILCNYN
ncbi:hypothetical protein ACFW04_012090 [Cataglyphis niger]